MLRYWPVILWLLYLILPYDLLPDVLPGAGRIDDILLLAFLYWTFMRKGRGQPTSDSADTASGSRENTGGEKSGSRERYWTRQEKSGDPYKILEINRSASLEEVKRAYRIQASRYHPDKVSHLGDEFQTLAKEKFQAIQKAYEQIVKEKGQS